jgi:RHS repeat-associated protein
VGGSTIDGSSYSVDNAGNRTAKTDQATSVMSNYTFDAIYQLTQWGTASLYYDAEGNMTSDGSNSYVWNARNQLASMDFGAFSFEYDAYGRRVGKTGLGTTTNYLYDRANIVQELVSGTPTANLLTGGIDEIFTRTDSNGTADFLRDALGSTIALADSSGTVQTEYMYEPFGNVTINGSVTTPYQYTGRENEGTGLYFYRARYYDPALARFISEDPAGFAGGINLYGYVANDPLRYTDPFGMDKGQPQSQGSPPQQPNRWVCAAQTADKYSLAGALGTTNKTGFFANVFNGIAGNSVSGIVMTFNHGNKWNTVGGVADTTLGITPATVNALTTPAATTELNLTGVGEFANFAGDGLGGIFATGKLIYDATSFGIAYVACGK